MPMRPVTIRRWEVVGAFVLLVVVAVGVAWWNDYRIDQAEKRITENAVRIATANEVRRQLVTHFREMDTAACRQIEELKTGFRRQAVENFANLERNAELLGIVLTPALREQAEIDRNRTLDRYAAREC